MKNLDLSQFVRRDFVDYEEYKAVPSAYDLSVKNNISIENIDKLDANENVFGPTKKLNKILSNFRGYQYYPDPEYKRLRTAISEYIDISNEYIAIGSGGDELIDLLLRLILEPGDEVINCPPTFGSYTTSTFLNRGRLIDITRKDDLSIDVKKIQNSINEKTKLIIICNPNNPTGNLTPIEEINKILESKKLVLIDEAYFEFSGKTVLPFIKKYPNLIILRSFSKWAGIAGLRLGYIIANPYFVKQLMKIKSPYNVNVAAELAGLIALAEMEINKKIINKIIKEREKIYKATRKNNNLKVYPSDGNFLFIQPKVTLIPKIKAYFQRNKIAVRYYDSPLTGKAIRITIGTKSQNNKVINILNRL